MDTHASAQALHDRATRGDTLSAAEQALLADWYADQDRQELERLSKHYSQQSLDELRASVGAAARQIHEVTNQIEALASSNDETQREIERLEAQLAQRAAAPSA